MKNSYYDIAYNNLLFLESNLHTEFYNDIAVNCQQIAEKLLKSVVEEVYLAQDDSVDKLMRAHNLRALYDSIYRVVPEFMLDRGKLSMLKDYYYDAKYPGDSFVTVTKEECYECVEILYDVIEQVNKFRKKNNLTIYDVERKCLG